MAEEQIEHFHVISDAEEINGCSSAENE